MDAVNPTLVHMFAEIAEIERLLTINMLKGSYLQMS